MPGAQARHSTVERAVELWVKYGLNASQIAIRLGVKKTQVRSWIASRGLSKEDKPRHEEAGLSIGEGRQWRTRNKPDVDFKSDRSCGDG